MIQYKYLSSIFFSLLLAAGIAGAESAVTEAEAAATAEQTTTDAADATEAMAETEAEPAAAAASEPMATGSVTRAAFATDIQDHEPADQISNLSNDKSRVYFFTELTDLQGQQAIHRWEYNGEVVAEVPFNVGGNRWRVWSSKNLQSDWTGSWKVSVINGSGDVIAIQSLQYEAAPEQPAVAATEEPAAETAAPVADTTEDLNADESAPAEGQ